MGRPHSDPYPTGDPNKSDEEVLTEAAKAWAKWQNGHTADEIAAELGISRRTFYNRLEKLMSAHGRPSATLIQIREWERLERYTQRVDEYLDGDVSNADAVKFLSEGRQLSIARQRLFGLPMEPEDAGGDDESTEQLDEWVAEAQQEADAELRRVRNGDGSA